ncbi:Smr/MutS family protein [Bombella sp. TMW 2.2559]|uniref:Smr/MutS family protein n=1 Tax=Bombella dulcis TaxID=2967339 RepID=A0ABT3W9U8_9PROT|nr:Smr/MutS family protein [Bombella dulcis]MCX5615563.1 Smr/MutS family protein [Bombella dulcis]
MARRVLGEDEAALWRAFVHDVAPLRTGRNVASVPVTPSFGKEASSPAGRPAGGRATGMVTVRLVEMSPVQQPRVRPAPHVGVRAPGLDDTQWRRLSRGQMRVDARLDLHGYIVQEAFEEFHRFMQRSRVMGWRCVEVVTGLGSGARGGSIRRELPHWLHRADIAPMILGVVHSHQGNQGALRLLLRKKR